jgi:hypothetical protein
MSTYSDYYNTGSNLAKLEFEKQAFIGALAKGIWNSAPRKALGYLTGMGGRVGQKGSFAYKYLPSSTIGAGLGGGIFGAATAEEGNKMNAFAAGAVTGLGFGVLGNNAGRIGARVFNPFMRRANINRYKNMGFTDDNIIQALNTKNEFNYLDNVLSDSGGHIKKLKNYTSSDQFKNLSAEHQDFIRKGLSSSNNNYVSDDFIKQLKEMQTTAKQTAKEQFSKADNLTKSKYYGAKTLKTVGSVGGGLGISLVATEPLTNFGENVANKFVPKKSQTPSNTYNPYYGGM